MAFSQDWSGQLVGDYRLLRRLGSGSFGEVYQAQDQREGGLVAVKLIKAQLTQREDLKAFLNEARSMRLRHPHIVPLLDFGLSENDWPFLVMEYVASGTLRDRYPRGHQVPLDTVEDLTRQLASALQYAHDRYLVHRDVKPENMLCRSDGTLLLSDFGIASVAHASSSVQAYQSFGGTLPYMAPEQHAGKPRPASDQYALAVVVYEWLAGTRPFQGTVPELVSQHLHAPPPPLREHLPTLAASVEQVVLKALSKDPQERFARIEDFAAALQASSQGRGAPHPQAAPSPLRSVSVAGKPSEMDQGGEPGEVGVSTPATPGVESGAARSEPGTVAPTLSSSASTIRPAREANRRDSLTTPVPVLTQQRRHLPRYALGAIISLLLLAFSGSALLYSSYWTPTFAPFSSGNGIQRRPTFTPAQAATATAAAHAYATGVARHGAMMGFDAAHTNLNPYERTIGPGNVSQLTPLWNFAVGGIHYNSSPIVADGMVYVGSEDGKFYAFDATCRKACQPLWSFATGHMIYASSAVAGGMVYVGSSDGRFYAFDAICRKACQPLWSFDVDGAIESAPTVAGGMVYIGSWRGTFYAFDATCRRACQPLWSFTAESSIDTAPAVAGGMVYIGSYDHNLYAFDATCRKACQPLWSFATGDKTPYTPLSSPTVAGGMVYVGSGDGTIYAFDATCRKACQPLWSYGTNLIIAALTVADGMVYVGSEGGKLYAFDATCRKTCQPLWVFTTENVILSSPVIAGSLLYIISGASTLYAFDATCRKNCQPLQHFVVGDPVPKPSSPAVADGMIYVGSGDHKLYAFGLAS